MLVVIYVWFLVNILGNIVNGEWRDEPCERSNREVGICTRFAVCSLALDLEQISRDICHIENGEPLVCCSLQGIKSKKKCGKYYGFPYDILHLDSPNTNNTSAASTDFLSMAALGYAKGSYVHWICGGALISDQFVLTTAHCLYGGVSGATMLVALGFENLTSNKQPSYFEVAEKFIHPFYVPPSAYDDIGLVKLKTKVIFNAQIQPVCLEWRTSGYNSMSAASWRNSTLWSKLVLQLKRINVREINNCQQKYNTVSKFLTEGYRPDFQICIKEEDSTCQVNIENILFVRHAFFNVRSLVGFTAMNGACGTDSPSLFTRVSKYIPWIEDIVWSDFDVYSE